MKINLSKTFAACMAMLFVFGTAAEAQNKRCLRDVTSDMEGDYMYYGYNDDGSLDSVYQYMGFYDEDSYRLYKYDDRGNMIKELGYGVLPSTDIHNTVYSKVFEVIYSFDESNRLISRANYNIDEFSANLDFYLGGVYTYEYNEKGLLSMRKLYWDEAKTQLFEETSYVYDDSNRLIREIYVSNGFYGKTEDMNVEYYYDEKGRMIKKVTKTLDPNSAAMEESGITFYDYDAADNLVKRTTYDNINPDIPSQKHILLYSDDVAAGVAYPINYEDDMDFYTKSEHTAVTDSIYMRDADATSIQLFDVQHWHYADLTDITGIENAVGSQSAAAFVRDGDGNIMVEGIDASDNVRIYDVSGKLVRSAMYSGRVDVNTLPSGMYVLVTRMGSMKFSR